MKSILGIKNQIINVITESSEPKELIGLDFQFEELHKILSGKSSNSVLLLGPRGSGKTSTLNKVLKNLGTKYIKIYLNGKKFSEDKRTLKTISRALNVTVEEEGTSFAEKFIKIFQLVEKRGQNNNHSIIFIVDEFHLFVEQSNQALVYNLFDIVQSSRNTISVVGLTTRLDIMEGLEKRVKSRFSHRQILFYPPSSLENFNIIIKNALTPKKESDVDKNDLMKFTENLDNFISKSENFKRIVQSVYSIDRSIRRIFRILLNSVVLLDENNCELNEQELIRAFEEDILDQKVILLNTLSRLDVGLLVSMKKLVSREQYLFNFEMVYDTYQAFGCVHGLGVKKKIAFKSFEYLQSLDLMIPHDTLKNCPKEYKMYRLALSEDSITDAIQRIDAIPFALKRWGSNNY